MNTRKDFSFLLWTCHENSPIRGVFMLAKSIPCHFRCFMI
nr:MAG TPA: hypothetical protein [Caudoviricetes sp.]